MSKTADTTTDDRGSDRSNDFIGELGAILSDCGADEARIEGLEDAFSQAVEARVDERVADLEETAEEMRTDIARLDDEVGAVREEFDSLRRTTERDLSEVGEDIEELEEEVEDLDQKWYKTLQDVIDVEFRLDDLEDWQESVDGDDLADSGQPRLTDLTSLERMELLGVEQVLDSHQGKETAERALTIAEHLEEWGEKTPKGLVLRCSDHNLLNLLRAEHNNPSLEWKQAHRACRKIVAETKGAVVFLDRKRHGRVLCLHEDTDLYERVTNGSSPLTASSVEHQERPVSA